MDAAHNLPPGTGVGVAEPAEDSAVLPGVTSPEAVGAGAVAGAVVGSNANKPIALPKGSGSAE